MPFSFLMTSLMKAHNSRSGCNVNAKSTWSEKTALAVAAFAGEVDVFELLINHGASGSLDSQLRDHSNIMLQSIH